MGNTDCIIHIITAYGMPWPMPRSGLCKKAL